jgi:hypothetical protein
VPTATPRTESRARKNNYDNEKKRQTGHEHVENNRGRKKDSNKATRWSGWPHFVAAGVVAVWLS